ncbi:S9 family peptidase [Salinisphaera sp. Q1T1-3]|uniref:S9 family peptidase n=1 Tax=Salinisphaera sp. Q1T1-3 TaxID=2321229 RepID=UPI000E7507A2|nr:S9 family peptidase [Salinisphaera sp. Q1T1-3]RJS91507.1 S9 family peptidase [Salinisphaera sp. Q1T1-3]
MSESTPRDRVLPAPPLAARQPHPTTIHGADLADDYAWLRDAQWREAMLDPARLDADIRAHLDAENDYTEAVLADTEDLQRRLVAEMRARMAEVDASVPTPDGDHVYYVRFREGGQHPIFCRAPRSADGSARPGEALDGETILLDGDAEAEGRTYFSLGAVDHSPDHSRLAFALDERGSEAYTIHVRDIDTGVEIQPPIDNATGTVAWSADSQTLFYVTLDDNHRPCRVWRLPLGADQASAELVYEEPDPGFFVSLGETQSGRYLLIHAHDHATSETRYIPAATPHVAPALIAARQIGREYSVDDDNGTHFVMLTNAGEAEDFRLVRAPIEAPDEAQWEELVPHQPGRLILDHVELARFRVRMERADALPRIIITDKQTGTDHAIAFEAEAYSLGMSVGYEYDTSTLRFLYSAPHTPDETFDYDMATRARTLRKQRQVPSGFDTDDYIVRRSTAETHDGEQVPITITHHKDTPLDGSAPCLLHGYGAYGISEPAAFSASRFSLIDRGFVYAIAHVRGGKERGYRWYREGKLARKPNTFADFIRVAEHLIETGYTGAGRIAAHGGSAGGMLVGAVVNQRPELFGAAVADVPFVDVLNTMMDDSLPLTPPEWPEWGNPRDDADAFATIRSYCPYQNVTAQAYPALLVIAGVSDPRVTYWEPAKWVAKLRATKTDTNTLLLKTHMAAGHGGLPGRFAALEETGLIYAFLLRELAPAATRAH